MIRVQTQSGAVYQIDRDNKQARRVDPDPEKTLPYWRDYAAYWLDVRLVILWNDGKTTLTTPIQRTLTVH